MSIDVNIYKNLYHFDLNVQFKIENEILAIVGESGSGKTMILKNIAGIENPDKGYIKNNDKIFFNSDLKQNLEIQKRKVGFLFQNYALFPHLTVLENLKIIFDKKDLDERYLIDLLNIFKVGHLINMKPNEISGGERQRVAIARLICAKPEIILMDEPFSALDTNLKWEIESELICFLKQYNKPVIFVTHNMDEALRISDKVLLINHGKIVDFGNKKEVLKPKSTEAAKLLGFKNILNGIEELNNFIEKNYEFDYSNHKIILDSKSFKFIGDENDLVIKAKLKYYTEDSNYHILVLNSEKNPNKNLTVEINKERINNLQLREFLLKSEESIIIYYPKEDIILV